MNLNGGTILLLCAAAMVLAVIAVLIDRLNFPQSNFRAKQIKPSKVGPSRDRTGAHIREVEDDSSIPDTDRDRVSDRQRDTERERESGTDR